LFIGFAALRFAYGALFTLLLGVDRPQPDRTCRIYKRNGTTRLATLSPSSGSFYMRVESFRWLGERKSCARRKL